MFVLMLTMLIFVLEVYVDYVKHLRLDYLHASNSNERLSCAAQDIYLFISSSICAHFYIIYI